MAGSALQRASDWYGWRELPTYGRTAWIVTAGTLLLGVGRGIVAPFLVLYLVTTQHISLAVVGLGIALEFVIRAFVGPLAGMLSDRIGRKPLMLMGLLGTTVLLPSYLLVTTSTAFLAISVANGIFAGPSLYGPASSALVADVVPANRRGAVFGLVHASRNLGWTLGIALGALLIDAGYLPIFIAGGVLPFLFFFVILALVKEPRVHAAAAAARPHPFAAWRALFGSRLFVAYLALTIVFYLGWGQVNTIFTLYLTDGLGLSARAVALIAINSALIFFFQVPFGRLADRSSRTTLLAFAALALGAAYAAYVWAPLTGGLVLGALVVGIVIFTLAEMLYSPVLNSLAADLAATGTTGSALGVLAFASAIGQGAPPLLADRIVPTLGWGALWALFAATCVASAIGLRWLGRRIPARADRPASGAE